MRDEIDERLFTETYGGEICPEWTHEYKQSRAEVELSTRTELIDFICYLLENPKYCQIVGHINACKVVSIENREEDCNEMCLQLNKDFNDVF